MVSCCICLYETDDSVSRKNKLSFILTGKLPSAHIKLPLKNVPNVLVKLWWDENSGHFTKGTSSKSILLRYSVGVYLSECLSL